MMEQGQIYDITHFSKRRHVSKYKVVDHDAQLYFKESTKFEPVEHTLPPIPQYAFHLLDFN
ncbi:hypothetical protein RchiOBHm_Chr5g0060091 [Rosa chinensis]|uniref:Uncharacterized protein n=1 Tax=Rosa chinensis TaxID=74649 RepID=A0A2P6QHK4_ROSCH|nr:hypothetical protein RchiOBHm_Chr5g0060091 [Rosa chinensis]